MDGSVCSSVIQAEGFKMNMTEIINDKTVPTRAPTTSFYLGPSPGCCGHVPLTELTHRCNRGICTVLYSPWQTRIQIQIPSHSSPGWARPGPTWCTRSSWTRPRSPETISSWCWTARSRTFLPSPPAELQHWWSHRGWRRGRWTWLCSNSEHRSRSSSEWWYEKVWWRRRPEGDRPTHNLRDTTNKFIQSNYHRSN